MAIQQGGNLGYGYNGLSYSDDQMKDMQSREMRMRCLDMANRGPLAGTKEVIVTAQAMYEFAIGNGK